MAKKPGRPKKSQRNDETAKIDSGILKKAKYVADIRDIPVAEYLTESLRPIVERDFARAVKQTETPERKE